jgi:hypothetical protein
MLLRMFLQPETSASTYKCTRRQNPGHQPPLCLCIAHTSESGQSPT